MPRFDGFGGISTDTGTGYLDITSTPAGFRALAALPDGTKIEGGWQTATLFENGLYEKTGGATPRLTRTEIYSQIDGTTDPVNWPAGDKLFWSGAGALTLPSLRDINVWLNHQYLRSKKLALDASDTTWLDSDADGEMRLVLAAAEFLRCLKVGGVPRLRAKFVDSGAGAGPIFELLRDSTNPDAGDGLGQIPFNGMNEAHIVKTYARIASYIVNQGSSAEAGKLLLSVLHAGALADVLELRGDAVLLHGGVNDSGRTVLVGKSGAGLGNVGLEARSDGLLAVTTSGIPCAYFNRKVGNGSHLGFFVGENPVGTLGNSAGTLAIGGAVMAHPSEWVPNGRGGPAYESLGWVVCSADGVLDDASGRHPLVDLSTRAADPRVYGVVGHRESADPESTVFGGKLMVDAAGSGMARCVGPIRNGDLLMTSDVPGCAQAQPDEGQYSYTLGKARQDSPDLGGARLVPCTLLAG
ncbi:MAG: hypothetical protein WAS21_06770 [Geminicoccaceae bacterium]